MSVVDHKETSGNPINLSELVACRLCGETNMKLKYYFLRNNDELLAKINNVIQIKINVDDPNDSLCPSLICEGCFHRIGEFNQFKIRCEYYHSKWMSQRKGDGFDVLKSISIKEANSQFNEIEMKCNVQSLIVDHQWGKNSNSQSFGEVEWIKTEDDEVQEEEITESENLTNLHENQKIDKDTDNASFRVDRYGSSYWTTAFNYMTQTHEGSFQCKLCPATFKWSYLCELHVRGHTKETPFTCQYCNKGFTAKHYLSSHMKDVHEPSIYMCKICGRQFSRNYLLIEHEMEHSGSPKIKCPQCNAKFYGKTKLTIHIRTFHSNRCFTCDICGKEYKTKIRLSEHLIRHFGYKSFRCNHCDTGFVTQRDLNAHLKRESHLKNLRSFE